MAARSFTPELFAFLTELRRHNERAWFLRNKHRYVEHVQQPLLRFIGDFAPLLWTLSEHFTADPRPTGGSMFRIYRDTRFSRDKSPYKTHAAAQFRHEAGRDVHAPGFYFHLEPGGCFAAAGLWHPDRDPLLKVRQAIVERPAAWKKVLRSIPALEGERLARPPLGFDPRHPLLEDLKRKDFVTSIDFSEPEVCAPGFLSRFAQACRTLGPLMQFLTEAVGLPW